MKYLPAAACAVLVLMGMLLAGFNLMLEQNESGEQNTKVKIALVGDTDDPFMQMGLTMLENMDSSRYTLEILSMELETARQQLSRRELNAYVVIPENFIDNALMGRVEPLEFVSHRDSSDLAAVFKKEMTGTIATMALEAQRSVYGLMDIMIENQLPDIGSTTDQAALEAVRLVLARDKMYRVQEIGVAEGMNLSQTLMSGLTVLLMLLACLPFTSLLVRRDTALNRVMAAKGKPVWLQILWELVAYFVALAVLSVLVLVLCKVAGLLGLMPALTVAQLSRTLLYLMPALLMAATLSFMLCSFTQELISGVLLQFFVSVAMCFVSGCIYPVDFFPVQVQKLAAWLPAGVARSWVAGAWTGETSWTALGALLGYCALFVAVSLLTGRAAIRGKQR